MTNKLYPNMNEENDLNEANDIQPELDMEYDELFSDKFYLEIGNKKCGDKPLALAFSIPEPDKLKEIIIKCWTLTWTKPALKDLSAIQKATGADGKSAVKNLPYVSLRGLMEIGLNNIARIQSDVGLKKYDLEHNQSQKYTPKPFAYLTDASSQEEIEENLQDILSDWIANYLKPFADKAEVSPEIMERLQEMQEQGELLTVSGVKVQVLPWDYDKKTGTTKSKGNYDFGVLADYASRLIAGKEIFTGLGPMKRIISSSRSLTSGEAELITDPISIDDESGKFSLLLQLKVITIPYLNQPLLKIDVSKRRWLNDLRDARYNDSQITGFMFSDDYTDRAFTYTVFPQKDQKYSQQVKKSRKKQSEPQESSTEKATYSWVTGKDFEPLREKFRLSIQTFNGQQIVDGKASTKKCKVLLTYKNGLQDDHGIQAGVPEIDKLEAYEKIAEIFESVGLKPFDAYSAIKPEQGKAHSSQKLEDAKASRMINLPTLLKAILLPDGNSSQNIASLSDSELDDLLRQKFGINLEMILEKRKSLEFNEKDSKKKNPSDELNLLISENKAAFARLYPQEKLRLIIFCENKNDSGVKLLEAIAHLLYGASLEIVVSHLPANTHGPKINLPGKDLKKAKERSAKRIEAWQHTSKQVANPNYRTFCLVMARHFYEEANQYDDKVNKPSTRKALATDGRSCVQFIIPIEKTIKTKKIKLESFFHRVQSALKDLLFAHSGRIDGVQEKVDKYLANTPAEKRPKEIIGITVVRKQSGRVIGKRDDTFLPVAICIQVATGICEMCCAYEKGNKLADVEWRNFADALAFVATLSPIKLGDYKTKPRLFLEFVEKVISDSVDAENHPLVMIDSSNLRGLWAWLRDTDINSSQINLDYELFGSRQNFKKYMEENWLGASLIRIRQDIAPGIIQKKERWLAESFPEDTRTKAEMKKLSASKKIPSATSPTGLFKVNTPNKDGCIVYISMERREQMNPNARGQSCYRKIEVNKNVKKDGKNICNQAGEKLGQLLTSPATKDQWPTPNPLEIAVTWRQPEDNPDDLAALVESLRYSFGHYGDWTSLPAPLFFERVVRDYISEFNLDDNETEDDSEEEKAEDDSEEEKPPYKQLSLF